MSFALTENQIRNRTKTVTRRLGWKFLKAGTEINAVNKCMGLKKGEKPIQLARVFVKSVRQEQLNAITPADVVAEGFGEAPIFGSPKLFIEMFCQHMNVTPGTTVTRIEFEYLDNSDLPERCEKCGTLLSDSDLDEASTKCYRCRNNISTVSGVGIMTHAKV